MPKISIEGSRMNEMYSIVYLMTHPIDLTLSMTLSVTDYDISKVQ